MFVNSLKYSAPVMTLDSRDTQKQGEAANEHICYNSCTEEIFRMRRSFVAKSQHPSFSVNGFVA